MEFSTLVGSLGVILLLFAFALNLFNWLRQDHWLYIWLNIIGASLSCYASLLIDYMPFVILEGTWALVALFGFIRGKIFHF